VVQVRITKKGDAQVHRSPRDAPAETAAPGHDRVKRRLLDVGHPDVRAFLTAVGVADHEGRIKPSRQDKYLQVEEFVKLLDKAVDDARTAGVLPEPTVEKPWRLVDLGCGNAYLTIGAYVWLARVRGLPVRVHGIDVRESSRARNAARAAELGWGDELTFEAATIADAADEPRPQVVVALHACDTATDDALARAVHWEAPVVLASPCCHHDLQAQLADHGRPAPAAYSLLTRHGLLRERFLDVLTDAFRASLLRAVGYRVDTVQFVGDEHTPRNLLLRAVRTGAPPAEADLADYDALTDEWGLDPALADRIPVELAAARARATR
jgi:SAM-dependent methyltransferase